MRQKRIHQSVFRVSRARMNDQTGGLVEDEEIVILEKNVERDRFGSRFDFLELRFVQRNRVSGFDSVARPAGFPVHRDKPVRDQRLEARPRKAGKREGQEPIETFAGVRGGNGDVGHG